MDILKFQRFGWLAIRITLGWYFLYAGFSKITDATWSAAGYLQHAKTFSSFYGWLASPAILPVTNFLNEWGLLLIGVSLLLGVCIKWSGWAGALMMILYYFPVLAFPLVGEHGYIVDEHLIYASMLLLLAAYHRNNPAWLERLLRTAK